MMRVDLEFEVHYSQLRSVIFDVKYHDTNDTNFHNYSRKPTLSEHNENASRRRIWTCSEHYSSVSFRLALWLIEQGTIRCECERTWDE